MQDHRALFSESMTYSHDERFGGSYFFIITLSYRDDLKNHNVLRLGGRSHVTKVVSHHEILQYYKLI